MKKGFTLVELLAVIVILSLLALLTSTAVAKILSNAKSDLSNVQTKLLESAAKSWAAEYMNELPSNDGQCKYLMVKDLIENGLIDSNVVDPSTSKNIPDDLKIKITSKIGKYGNVLLTYEVNPDNTTGCIRPTNGVYIPDPVSFAADSWDTIIANVKAGNLEKYKVGDTKKIKLGEPFNKEYTVRIANTSTPSECSRTDFSQTACGFVVEFVDIISKQKMNEIDTNVGGWKSSNVRKYLNITAGENDSGTVFNALPEELKNEIIDTRAISGHGTTTNEQNFVTIDKLYLLSPTEIYGSSFLSSVDTAKDKTRQLDYYEQEKVTASSSSGAKKDYEGAATIWWLRSAYSSNINDFLNVTAAGGLRNLTTNYSRGVVPIFRLGIDDKSVPESKSFKDDSWSTIIANVKAGNLEKYKVGDTKKIKLGEPFNKEYTVRIANVSTPSECNNVNFSQTACGFVVEFVDIIEERSMNETNTNVGGWKESAMRKYLNVTAGENNSGTVFNALPKELQNAIVDTRVISGHGENDNNGKNFVTEDKLYLLSPREVWIDGTSIKVSTYDTAYNSTRQLDYYEQAGITGDNYSGAIKKYNGSATIWWLRSASSSNVSDFRSVSTSGSFNFNLATNTRGVAPSFRLGTTNQSVPEPKSFATDSWDTIVANVKAGNLEKYKVGDTKKIKLGGSFNKEYTLRIVNISTPSGCNNVNFSQTACGFVVEFADLISQQKMNEADTNEGGWEDSDMRKYLNVTAGESDSGTVFNALPKELQNVIIETGVISGNNSTSSTQNFKTTDKLYLLTSTEIYGSSFNDSYDNARDKTRQLDYYEQKKVTTSVNLSYAIKEYEGSATYWWLRSAHSRLTHGFYSVSSSGSSSSNHANDTYGVAPAFRIG